MSCNNDETFREYTEKRIESYKKIQSLFPEYFININLDGLRDAYNYEDHMVKVKLQLEKFFGRDLNWNEVDQYSTMINQYTARSVNISKPIESIEDQIEAAVLCRNKFCKVIGLEFNEIDNDDYRKALRTSIENNINLHRNLSGTLKERG
jgi:hypothetical protein